MPVTIFCHLLLIHEFAILVFLRLNFNNCSLFPQQKRRISRLQMLFGWNIHFVDVTSCLQGTHPFQSLYISLCNLQPEPWGSSSLHAFASLNWDVPFLQVLLTIHGLWMWWNHQLTSSNLSLIHLPARKLPKEMSRTPNWLRETFGLNTFVKHAAIGSLEVLMSGSNTDKGAATGNELHAWESRASYQV